MCAHFNCFKVLIAELLFQQEGGREGAPPLNGSHPVSSAVAFNTFAVTAAQTP